MMMKMKKYFESDQALNYNCLGTYEIIKLVLIKKTAFILCEYVLVFK